MVGEHGKERSPYPQSPLDAPEIPRPVTVWLIARFSVHRVDEHCDTGLEHDIQQKQSKEWPYIQYFAVC
jgi:hypothetical protein